MCFLTENHEHFILYGNNDMKSYHYMLENMKELSPSKLTFSRKTTIETTNQDIVLPMSDIHLEIDFQLLGVNEYSLFFEIYRHVSENIVLNKKKLFLDMYPVQYKDSNILQYQSIFLSKKKSQACKHIPTHYYIFRFYIENILF